jgi:hypothetical protein
VSFCKREKRTGPPPLGSWVLVAPVLLQYNNGLLWYNSPRASFWAAQGFYQPGGEGVHSGLLCTWAAPTKMMRRTINTETGRTKRLSWRGVVVKQRRRRTTQHLVFSKKYCHGRAMKSSMQHHSTYDILQGCSYKTTGCWEQSAQ